MPEADPTAPRHRTDRVVDAFLHGGVDVVGRGDALVDGIGRLVDQHRDGTRHREPRHVGKHRDLLAEQDEQADRLAQVLVAGLRRRSESDAGAGSEVERQVEQHHRLADQAERSVAVRPSLRAMRVSVDADEPVPRPTLDAGLSFALEQIRER